MRICTKCRSHKEDSEFSRKNSRFLRSECTVCYNEARRKSYKDNEKIRSGYTSRQNRRGWLFRRKLVEYLLDHPCVDCGETDPLVLEFDHLRDKKQGVGTMHNTSWAAVMIEINKCEVRCASCHQRVTHQRQNSIRYQICMSLKETIDTDQTDVV